MLCRPPSHSQSGFSLIQISVLLAISALVLTANLPGNDAGDFNKKALATFDKLDKVEAAMQSFMAAKGRRPCPADGQYDVNVQRFGMEAGELTANSPTGDCIGGDPAAPMGPDIGTGNIYMGNIPTKSLGLPDDYAFDAWGRRFSYIVDKRATTNESCYNMVTSKTDGGINITYKDITGATVETETTMYTFISHGADGHGAWPPQGSTVAGRLNRNNNDADTLNNAGINAAFTYNTTLFTNTKVKKDRTTTFDDLVYYHRDTRNICCIGEACTLYAHGAFTETGAAANAAAGASSAMADINGDGIDDMIVAAPTASPGGRANAGAVYVTFGRNNLYNDPLSVSTLNGTTGFTVEGQVAGDRLGDSVTIGDLNGDAIPDLIIGAPQANSARGEVDVVFGGTGAWPTSLVVSALAGTTGVNGTAGIRANGANASDKAGTSVAMSDVNGDTVSDLIIGTPGYSASKGVAYVVFGGTATWTGRTPVSLSALNGTTGINGTNGTALLGETATTEQAGYSVAGCDVNGDGIGDIVVGAPRASILTRTDAGKAYVLFGKSSAYTATATLMSVNGTTGFYDKGSASNHMAGKSVACGDMNADGLGEVIVGAPNTNVTGTNNGSVYVHYGQTTAYSVSQDLNSLRYYSNGYRMDGGPGEHLGTSIAAGSDVNGDGVPDLIMGAPNMAPGGRVDAGGAYIYFGKVYGMFSKTDLTVLNGQAGVIVDGPAAGAGAGSSVALGNINARGTAIAVIGAPNETASGNAGAGKTYSVQGQLQWPLTPYDLTTVP
jgi:hypothetical protein